MSNQETSTVRILKVPAEAVGAPTAHPRLVRRAPTPTPTPAARRVARGTLPPPLPREALEPDTAPFELESELEVEPDEIVEPDEEPVVETRGESSVDLDVDVWFDAPAPENAPVPVTGEQTDLVTPTPVRDSELLAFARPTRGPWVLLSLGLIGLVGIGLGVYAVVQGGGDTRSSATASAEAPVAVADEPEARAATVEEPEPETPVAGDDEPAEPAGDDTGPVTIAHTASFELRGIPAETRVLYDGKELGQGPMAVSRLRPGPHELVLLAPRATRTGPSPSSSWPARRWPSTPGSSARRPRRSRSAPGENGRSAGASARRARGAQPAERRPRRAPPSSW